MALVLADRVRDTTTTTGTGTVTLSGTAPTGYQNFSVIGNGNTTYYTINAGSEWEVGIGTYSSTGPTLSRDTVLESSNANALVNFSAGTKDVFVTYPSDKSVIRDADGDVGIGTTDPGYRLDVVSGDASFGYAARLRSNPTATTAILQFTDSGATQQNAVLAASDAGFLTIQADGASSAIGLRTNGAERARINSSGDVGIGIASPGAKLDVAGNIFSRPGGAAGAVAELTADASSGANGISLTAGFASGGYGPIKFFTTATERMRISSAGNLGLGMSGPVARLNVAAGAAVNAPVLGSATNYPAFFSNNDSSYGLGIGTSAADGRVWLQAQRADSSATTYNITLNEAGGNVGIGATSPQGKLDVQSRSSGAVTTGLVLDNRVANSAGTGIDLRFYVNDGGDARYAAIRSVQDISGNVADLRFITSNSDTPAERMRITRSGDVGIGTTSISYKLEVGGDLRIAGGGGDLRIQSATGTTTSGGDSQIYNDANNMIFTTGTTTAERFRIGSAGQFGLSGANYGNSGQVLASQGSGSAPTWLSMGVRSNGQNVISGSTTLGAADKGTNILIVTSGITITFPSSGYASGEGVAISNISGGNVTLSFPGGSDIGGTLPADGSFFAFCDGGGFWRQYCYSTSRL